MFEQLIVKKYKMKIFPNKGNTFNNITNILISLIGFSLAANEISYIFTAKRIDKLIKEKFKKENKK
ncbi:MAG: hypothetical protein BHV87_03700 [Clostridiales bacterium 36_14]|nr:MAG: hypothetical protein BHV87_03700 [Clostridiales bacterium 36_14]